MRLKMLMTLGGWALAIATMAAPLQASAACPGDDKAPSFACPGDDKAPSFS